MFMNTDEVDSKIEYLIVPKGTKFTGSGKLGLSTNVTQYHKKKKKILEKDIHSGENPLKLAKNV